MSYESFLASKAAAAPAPATSHGADAGRERSMTGSDIRKTLSWLALAAFMIPCVLLVWLACVFWDCVEACANRRMR